MPRETRRRGSCARLGRLHIQHEHVVTIYQVGQENGIPFPAGRSTRKGISLAKWLTGAAVHR